LCEQFCASFLACAGETGKSERATNRARSAAEYGFEVSAPVPAALPQHLSRRLKIAAISTPEVATSLSSARANVAGFDGRVASHGGAPRRH